MGISKRKGEGEEMYIFKKEYAVDVMKPQRCVLMVLGYESSWVQADKNFAYTSIFV